MEKTYRAYRDCTEEQRKLFERAGNFAAEWLNSMNTVHGDATPDDYVSWDNLFEFEPGPRLIFDSEQPIFNDCRLMVFELNFFWDEGGPAEMMVFFDEDGRMEDAYWAFDTLVSHMRGEEGASGKIRMICEEAPKYFPEEGI